jgi:hypothetical protein
MAHLYIVSDRQTGKLTARNRLQQARFDALSIQSGEIVRAELDDNLSAPELRCALFNRAGFAIGYTLIATIEKGIARKVTGDQAELDEMAAHFQDQLDKSNAKAGSGRR